MLLWHFFTTFKNSMKGKKGNPTLAPMTPREWDIDCISSKNTFTPCRKRESSACETRGCRGRFFLFLFLFFEGMNPQYRGNVGLDPVAPLTQRHRHHNLLASAVMGLQTVNEAAHFRCATMSTPRLAPSRRRGMRCETGRAVSSRLFVETFSCLAVLSRAWSHFKQQGTWGVGGGGGLFLGRSTRRTGHLMMWQRGQEEREK